MRLSDRLEASLEDPEEEGRRLAQSFLQRAEETGSARLVLFGLGVHTLRYLDAMDGDLLIVEPSLELCRVVLERVDLAPMLERAELLVSSDASEVCRHAIFRSHERGLLLAHPTARRRAPILFEALTRHFRPGGTPEPLQIAVIPPLHGGSLPVAQACARALRELGHHVHDVDLGAFWPAYQSVLTTTSNPLQREARVALQRNLLQLIGEVLLASFRLNPPDVIFALAQAPLEPDILERIGQLGIGRAFWFCEDFRVMSYWKDLARHYDVVFHVQPDEFSVPLREAGGYGFPLPMAFDPTITRPLTLTPEQQRRYGCELSFVGAGYHNRRELLPALFDLGLRIYGVDWPTTPPWRAVQPEPNIRQSPEASNLIFNASKINLNLHSSPWCDGVNPVGDYLNPRSFELAGARCFQLLDERRDLARAFAPGFEVETYGDVHECRKKIAHYLAHPDERTAIAENAYRRAVAEHTYRHRMERAVEALRAGPVPVSGRPRERTTVEAVMDSARDEPGLCEIMRRLEPERTLDREAITLAVGRGSGELTRDEKLLLYIRELLGDVRFLESGARVP